jgi:hypothetical protein
LLGQGHTLAHVKKVLGIIVFHLSLASGRSIVRATLLRRDGSRH